MRVAEQIKTILTASFAPTILEIEDVSHHHAHHAGAPAGGESHFELEIQSSQLTRILLSCIYTCQFFFYVWCIFAKISGDRKRIYASYTSHIYKILVKRCLSLL